MIFEYALDPEVVVRWCDRREWAVFDGRIGIGTHRIGCILPEEDFGSRVKAALQSFLEALPNEQERQRAEQRVAEVLRSLMEPGYTRRKRRLDSSLPWLDHARNEHSRRAFQGLIVAGPSAPRGGPFILPTQLGNSPGSAWTPRRPPHGRSADGIARALEPLLRCATRIRLVDPYFSAASDRTSAPYVDTLREIVRLAALSRDPAEQPKIELHTAIDVGGPRRSGEKGFEDERRGDRAPPGTTDYAEARRYFAQQLHESILSRLQSQNLELPVTVRFWARGRTDGMHNRYVLTELGGVVLGAGFDRPSNPGTDDATLLSREQHRDRWAQSWL